MTERWADPAVLQMLGASRAGERDREEALARLKETSAARLLKILETKLRTAFVASLARIEEAFGSLWGNKRRPGDMTEAERGWWDAYQAAREKILTNGNNQIRATQSEVCLYEIEWKGYRNELSVPATED